MSSNKLATYVEIISDEFKSTFTVVNDHTLMNMLGLKDDFHTVTKIIQKYLPNHTVWFSKTGDLGDDPYDIYLIKAVKEGK